MGGRSSDVVVYVVFTIEIVNKYVDVMRVITLSSKPKLTFSKEHQTGTLRFDALSRAKGALSLSFT